MNKLCLKPRSGWKRVSVMLQLFWTAAAPMAANHKTQIHIQIINTDNAYLKHEQESSVLIP